MKKVILVAIVLIGSYANAGVETFKIKGVGFSASSETIYVDVEKPHSQSECIYSSPQIKSIYIK